MSATSAGGSADLPCGESRLHRPPTGTRSLHCDLMDILKYLLKGDARCPARERRAVNFLNDGLCVQYNVRPLQLESGDGDAIWCVEHDAGALTLDERQQER